MSFVMWRDLGEAITDGAEFVKFFTEIEDKECRDVASLSLCAFKQTLNKQYILYCCDPSSGAYVSGSTKMGNDTADIHPAHNASDSYTASGMFHLFVLSLLLCVLIFVY